MSRFFPRLLDRSEQLRLALAGSLLALTFPPLPFGLLSLVALTPLLYVLDADERPGFRRGFVHGGFFGSVFYLILLFWLWDLTRFTPLIAPTWLVSCLYLGALVGLAVGAVQWLRARTGASPALLLPFAWIGLEKLLQYGDLRFTWGVLADTLTPYPLLLQTAEVWGALGLSFVIVAVNALVYTLWKHWRERRSRLRWALSLAALGGMVLLYGGLRWSALAPAAGEASSRASTADPTSSPADAAATLRVAVVQPNIPQEVRDDKDRDAVEKGRLFELSRVALRAEPDLVAWPETAASWLRFDPRYMRDLGQLCCGERADSVPFIVGGLETETPERPLERFYNAAFLVSPPGNITGVYRKVLLVPMTEKVPYAGVLGILKPDRWSGTFSAGDGFVPLEVPVRRRAERVASSTEDPQAPNAGVPASVRVGVPICYEVIFPQSIREFRRRGARLIVTITNDAWFGRTAAPYQHFSQVALRAVENRIPIGRAANTGISGFVSPRGEVLRKVDIFRPGVLVEDVRLAGPPTPYTRWGDWILPASWIGLGLALLLRQRSGRNAAPTRDEAPAAHSSGRRKREVSV